MTRPLKYDDAFSNILKGKMHEKFLKILNIKVQSTAFCQKLNLQKSLLICSLFDFNFGLLVLILFLNHYKMHSNNLTFLMLNILGILCLFFSFLGFDASLNLKKFNAKIYKNWRIVFCVLYICIEIGNSFQFICYYSGGGNNNTNNCNMFSNVLYFLVFVFVNFYITKIAWSFFIRLEKKP